jgi:O-methyltransferase involved in polyketide biosynthesis
MSMSLNESTPAYEFDESLPHPGRVYDWMLGGHHNFEADRVAGEELLRHVPSVRAGTRLNRWFMHYAVDYLVGQGFDCFLDLATGLPTEGYVHELAPDTLVLYNDRDPATVSYGRQIIGNNPKVRYIQSDIRTIAPLLQAADEHFQGNRRVAICFIGVAYLLGDEVVQPVLDSLYDWCDPGSQMAITWMDYDISLPQIQQMLAFMKRLRGGASVARSPEHIRSMLARWQINEPGIVPLTEWMDVPNWHHPEDMGAMELYGVIVTK